MTEIEALATELLNTIQILTTEIQGALETSLESAALSRQFSTAQRKWKETARRLLDDDAHSLRQELSSTAPSSIRLFRIADDETGLAKNLDTFCFDFAGPEWEKRLDHSVAETVKAAWNLRNAVKAANGS